MTTPRQFIAGLPVTDECIEWPFYLNKDGYAQTGGRRVSRIVYQMYVGPIDPESLTVDHLCFNRPCVNPRHLRLLPREHNSSRQRQALNTHCRNGHERTAQSVYVRTTPAGKIIRSCRICNLEAVTRYNKRKEERQ